MAIVDSDTHTDVKVCESCLSVFPVSDFRFRAHRRGRFNQCRSCHNTAERHRRSRRRAQLTARELDRFQRVVRSADSDHRVAAICSRMIAYFGGIERLAAAWKAEMDRASASQGGARFVLQSFAAIVRLIEASDHSMPELGQLTDEELDQRMVESIGDLVAAHPEVAVEAAHRLGWTLIPN